MVETLIMSKLRSCGSNPNFRFLFFVKSVTRKSLDSVLGLTFFISLTRRYSFLNERLTQWCTSSSSCVIKFGKLVFLFFSIFFFHHIHSLKLHFLKINTEYKKYCMIFKALVFGCHKKLCFEKTINIVLICLLVFFTVQFFFLLEMVHLAQTIFFSEISSM